MKLLPERLNHLPGHGDGGVGGLALCFVAATTMLLLRYGPCRALIGPHAAGRSPDRPHRASVATEQTIRWSVSCVKLKGWFQD